MDTTGVIRKFKTAEDEPARSQLREGEARSLEQTEMDTTGVVRNINITGSEPARSQLREGGPRSLERMGMDTTGVVKKVNIAESHRGGITDHLGAAKGGLRLVVQVLVAPVEKGRRHRVAVMGMETTQIADQTGIMGIVPVNIATVAVGRMETTPARVLMDPAVVQRRTGAAFIQQGG
jgi:hypothetical protein